MPRKYRWIFLCHSRAPRNIQNPLPESRSLSFRDPRAGPASVVAQAAESGTGLETGLAEDVEALGFSASGGDGIQVADCLVGYQDYIPPIYPLAARIAHVSGDVVIEVTIDTKGKPIKWNIIEGHPSLAAASLDVLPRWRFIPIKHKGESVNATFEVRIRFTLLGREGAIS